MKRAKYIAQPEIFIRHTPERSFIGPSTFLLPDGEILMVAPWGGLRRISSNSPPLFPFP